MRKTDKIEYLSQVPMFTECNKRELGEIARHLDAAIRTGTFCSYQPEHPVDWSL